MVPKAAIKVRRDLRKWKKMCEKMRTPLTCKTEGALKNLNKARAGTEIWVKLSKEFKSECNARLWEEAKTGNREL